jgi:hypothetical protein
VSDCYKAGEVNRSKDYFVVVPEGDIPTLDEYGYLWLNGEIIGCYECKNPVDLVMTITTENKWVLVTCGVCGRDVAKSEGVN